MSRELAAFIGHHFHFERTHSHSYFLRIFRIRFLLYSSYLKDYRSSAPSLFTTSGLGVYKYIKNIIIWQVHNWIEPQLLRAYEGNKIIFPMNDNDTGLQYHDYDPEAKYLCFCHHLHCKLSGYGLRSTYLPFYPLENVANSFKHKRLYSITPGLKAFFWYRGDVQISLVIKLCKPLGVRELTIKYSPDPHIAEDMLESLKNIDCGDISLKEAGWFPSRQDYLAQLGEHHIFFAPRYSEGIGFSFIEALALGLCVVAPNTPTHNEYIRHGQNGLLHNGVDYIGDLPDGISNLISNSLDVFYEGATKWRNHYEPILIDSLS